ncbi:hypothetical protein LH656_06850 [Streptococcus sinensis]|nr:hypothetical protein [Streptococcus sinensis]
MQKFWKMTMRKLRLLLLNYQNC